MNRTTHAVERLSRPSLTVVSRNAVIICRFQNYEGVVDFDREEETKSKCCFGSQKRSKLSSRFLPPFLC